MTSLLTAQSGVFPEQNMVSRAALPCPVTLTSLLIAYHQPSTRVERPGGHGMNPWEVLGQIVQSQNSVDAKSWWKLTGHFLGIMMQEADYNVHEQYINLAFHLQYIIPRLGPAPHVKGTTAAWKSFMTDDFSPLEYSWNWDTPNMAPKVRYSIEAISTMAGSSVDPFNRISTLELSRQLSESFPETNWSQFEALKSAFFNQSFSRTCKEDSEIVSAPQSSIFLAFELGHSIATKAYFIPVKAEQVGISRLSVLTQTIDSLRQSQGSAFDGYDRLLELFETSQGSKLHIIGVAIDCVTPMASRFKIYVRSPNTDFQSVCDMMNLGQTTGAPAAALRKELKDLWRLTLGLPEGFSETEQLPQEDHETAGVLYNFDIKPGSSTPEPKLYVPVKHYAANELVAAEGLGRYLKTRGRAAYYDKYMRVLQRTCTHRKLCDGRGFQTYIGVGLRKDGSLSLCSYLNGEVYHPRRWNL